MARLFDPPAEYEKEWRDWIDARPESIKPIAERFFPWEIYRIKATGQVVTLRSIGEPEGDVPADLTVYALGVPPLFAMPSYVVFGVDPDGVEPYEPASPEEMRAIIALAVHAEATLGDEDEA